MSDQDSVAARKAASASGAGDNSGIGVDGDGPSHVDTEVDHTASTAGTGQDDTPAERPAAD